jgi:ATPase subunit of ABC transporter with duplicated ATPase domains
MAPVTLCEITSQVTLVVSQGDSLLVTGPNGAGKTSMLRILKGEQYASGMHAPCRAFSDIYVAPLWQVCGPFSMGG